MRYRFLDPEVSPAVIVQKLRQTGLALGLRSVERVIADYGLQKKLCALNPKNPPPPLPVQRAAKLQRLAKTDPAIHQLRKRLGAPFDPWESRHLAKDLFSGLEGDLRVEHDTLLVTYDNVPNASQWKPHFENLPRQLEKEGVDPRVPWLYNFKLDFRFK